MRSRKPDGASRGRRLWREPGLRRTGNLRGSWDHRGGCGNHGDDCSVCTGNDNADFCAGNDNADFCAGNDNDDFCTGNDNDDFRAGNDN